VHRRSASQRTVQVHLNVRRELTDSRTRAIAQARAVLRGAGLRIRSGSTGSFLVRMAALELPASITETLAPLQRLIAVLNDEIATADDRRAAGVPAASSRCPVVTVDCWCRSMRTEQSLNNSLPNTT
jgi:hypothetical protein